MGLLHGGHDLVDLAGRSESSAPRFGRSSSENTHWNLREGNRALRLKRVRNAAASLQPFTFQNSATCILVGSIFNAAPIDDNSLGREAFVALMISVAVKFSDFEYQCLQ